MRKPPLLPLAAAGPIFLPPSRSSACVTSYGVPPVTTIQGVTPQVGIAGITDVYIYGWCFGASPGTVTLNGETMSSILMWNDAVIEFQLPFDATNGDLTVTSACCGSDDTQHESRYTNRGNGNVDATFTVITPNSPPYFGKILGASGPSQYVEGTWVNGSQTMTLVQGPQNKDGSWPLTGTENGLLGLAGDETCQLTGGTLDSYGDVLDQDGDIVLNQVNCNGNTIVGFNEWKVMGSGDVTSVGYDAGGYCPSLGYPDYPYFMQELGSLSGGTTNPVEYCELAPMWKTQTDLPAGEVPSILGWGDDSPPFPAGNPTFGVWARQLPTTPLDEFAGRFVYEQNAAMGATDTCFVTGAPSYVHQATGLTGGGWYVSPGGVWEYDDIGMFSPVVDWYQENVPLPCHFTLPQDMYVDGRTTPQFCTENWLTFEIDATEIYSEVQPASGSLVEACEYYSNSTATTKKCKP